MNIKRKIRYYHKKNYKDKINENIDKLSTKAFEQARTKALKMGLSVVVKIGSKIYRVYPNGEKKFIKKIKQDINLRKKRFIINLK